MKTKLTNILKRAGGCLLALLAVLTLLWTVFGWSPVLGNLVSAARMRSYAAQVWPGLKPEGPWAWYDLKSGGYCLEFALENVGGRRALDYDLKSGLVTDTRRAAVLRMDLGIARHLQINGRQAYWRARWDPSDPERAVVDIRIDFGDKRSAPVPDEETMRTAMADRAMELYEELSPRTPVHRVSVYYSHEAQGDKHGGSLWHSITVDLPEGEPLTREMVLAGKLVSR
nr:hypothetical protein [uncultured Oscillibacter sp.]